MLANAAIGSCAAHRAPAAEGDAAQSPTQNLAFGKKLAELMLKVPPPPTLAPALIPALAPALAPGPDLKPRS